MLYWNNPWQCPCNYACNNVKNIILNRLVKLNNRFFILQNFSRIYARASRLTALNSTLNLKLMNSTLGDALHNSLLTRHEVSRSSFCLSVELSKRGRAQKLKMFWILVLYLWFSARPCSCRINYVFKIKARLFVSVLVKMGKESHAHLTRDPPRAPTVTN